MNSVSCTPCGFAIVGGAVSGGLEVIDFDMFELFNPWADRIRQLRPGLLEAMVIVQSPRPGIHVYFRSQSAGPTRKLAQRREQDETTGRPKLKTLIEVKAEGGYVLAPGSPGCCHPTGRYYEFVNSNGFASIPTVCIADRILMLTEAMHFNEVRDQRQNMNIRPVRALQSNRPGDLFAAATPWASILEPHGWVCCGGSSAGISYWRRPGKSDGNSATTNYEGTDLLHVFSENAFPFEAHRSYPKFIAFALLNFNGNYKAAAAALVARGFSNRTAEPALLQRTALGARRRPGRHHGQ